MPRSPAPFREALGFDAELLSALKGLSRVHESRGLIEQAVELALRAEAVSGNRLERVELLWHAGQLVGGKLSDAERALDLYDRVLKARAGSRRCRPARGRPAGRREALGRRAAGPRDARPDDPVPGRRAGSPRVQQARGPAGPRL